MQWCLYICLSAHLLTKKSTINNLHLIFEFINQMAICAENKRKTAIVPRDYTNILVSLWEIISEKEYNILCLGALINSYLVFITNQCSKMLEPLSEVGVLTGINNITDYPERILNSKQRLRAYSKFSILFVSIPI